MFLLSENKGIEIDIDMIINNLIWHYGFCFWDTVACLQQSLFFACDNNNVR